jgi:hypothetical protein
MVSQHTRAAAPMRSIIRSSVRMSMEPTAAASTGPCHGDRFLHGAESVTIRTFKDSHGDTWWVWSTHPQTPTSVNVQLREGWLTFDSGTERRRVGPIPKGWETFSIERLELTCRVATPARVSDPNRVVLTQDEEVSRHREPPDKTKNIA